MYLNAWKAALQSEENFSHNLLLPKHYNLSPKETVKNPAAGIKRHQTEKPSREMQNNAYVKNSFASA